MNTPASSPSIIVLSLISTASLAGAAAPALTTLPTGLSWSLTGTGSYNSGTQSTELGGFNTQGAPPYQDSSFGVMDEAGTPWFTGNDLSGQQFVQAQVFGNSLTNSPPGPPGARFYNFGYTSPNTVNTTSQATSAGDNFPTNAAEQRSVSVNHWNNTNPDAGGVASLGQVVHVPTSATLTLGIGWGSDEMQLAVIGGDSGSTSEFRVDLNVFGMWGAAFDPTTQSGYTAGDRNLINMNGILEVNDAGLGGQYGLDGASAVPWGYGSGGSGNLINFNRDVTTDQIVVDGAYVTEPSQGIPGNSVGYSTSQNYNVLSTILQDGSAFSADFRSEAELFISRQFGNADARASTGPGMQGTALLVVNYETYTAVGIPEPSRAVLLLGGIAAMLLRRRRR